MIILKNKKILEYLLQKEDLVKTGRKMSKDIEKIEKEIATLDKEERKITDKVLPKDLIDEGEKLKAEINSKIEVLGEISKKISDAKLAAIPEIMVKKHYKLRDDKEQLERERNKIALKIQKVKDRLIPLVKKEVTPQLQEFEDIEKVEIKKGEAVVSVFNHVEEFKKTFKKKA